MSSRAFPSKIVALSAQLFSPVLKTSAFIRDIPSIPGSGGLQQRVREKLPVTFLQTASRRSLLRSTAVTTPPQLHPPRRSRFAPMPGAADLAEMDLQEISRLMQLQASALAEHAKSMSSISRAADFSAAQGLTSPESSKMTIYNHPLPSGVDIPRLGLGVFMATPQEAEEAIQFAFSEGYRHLDTARLYKNEAAVGRAVRNSGIPREEVFVTTKLWNSDHGYQNTLNGFQKSLAELGLDYVDLYLIHSPLRMDSRLDTWRAMEEILRSGKAKAVGVSNYGIHHLEELMANCTFTPAVNQIELHPFCTREKLVEFCRSHGIALEAYSPLTKGKRLKDPTLIEIAGHYKKSTAQLLIRWGLQKDFIVLPKSVTPSRIAANAQVFNFEISPEDMAALDALNENFVTGWDPTRSS